MGANKLAVFGDPIAHSRSPEIHQAFAGQVGIEIDYQKIHVVTGTFADCVTRFIDAGGIGFNVTLPYKGEAFSLVSTTSTMAARAQAVNTVVLDQQGRLIGHNTDGPGLLQDMRNNLGWQLANKKILLLGAGGAVQGVLPALLDASPRAIHLYNRTGAKAASLAAGIENLLAVTHDELANDYDLVINGTSSGLSGGSLQLPKHIITPATHCYTMTYGTAAADFSSWCIASGARQAVDGLGMLVEQAALTFGLWFGKPVQTKDVIALLRDLR